MSSWDGWREGVNDLYEFLIIELLMNTLLSPSDISFWVAPGVNMPVKFPFSRKFIAV